MNLFSLLDMDMSIPTHWLRTRIKRSTVTAHEELAGVFCLASHSKQSDQTKSGLENRQQGEMASTPPQLNQQESLTPRNYKVRQQRTFNNELSIKDFGH